MLGRYCGLERYCEDKPRERYDRASTACTRGDIREERGLKKRRV